MYEDTHTHTHTHSIQKTPSETKHIPRQASPSSALNGPVVCECGLKLGIDECLLIILECFKEDLKAWQASGSLTWTKNTTLRCLLVRSCHITEIYWTVTTVERPQQRLEMGSTELDWEGSCGLDLQIHPTKMRENIQGCDVNIYRLETRWRAYLISLITLQALERERERERERKRERERVEEVWWDNDSPSRQICNVICLKSFSDLCACFYQKN